MRYRVSRPYDTLTESGLEALNRLLNDLFLNARVYAKNIQIHVVGGVTSYGNLKMPVNLVTVSWLED